MANTKKESRKKFVILLLVILLLALAVGYAAFSDTLTISGTANVNGSFDLQFVSANCSVVTYQGCTASVSVSNEDSGTNVTNDKLVVSVADLAYPGAGAEIHAQIKNVGSIPAKITNVTATPTGNGSAIVISGLEIFSTSHQVVNPNGTCDFDFTVMWDPASTGINNTVAGENGNNYEFTLTITYEQETTNLNVTPGHNDVNPS